MKQMFQKTNVLAVLAYFFENPYSEVYLRQLARLLKMSPSTVMRSLAFLEKEQLISQRKEKNTSFFKANLDPQFKALKVAYTLTRLNESRITKLAKEKSQGLSSFLLYGSAARGEDGPDSDYDFLLIASASKLRAHELGELTGKETNLQTHSISQWKKMSKKNRAFYLDVLAYSIPLIGDKPVID